MARWVLPGTFVSLVLCVGFPAVAFADAAPAPAPARQHHRLPLTRPRRRARRAPPGYARPPVYPAAIPAVPAAQVADREEGRAPASALRPSAASPGWRSPGSQCSPPVTWAASCRWLASSALAAVKGPSPGSVSRC